MVLKNTSKQYSKDLGITRERLEDIPEPLTEEEIAKGKLLETKANLDIFYVKDGLTVLLKIKKE